MTSYTHKHSDDVNIEKAEIAQNHWGLCVCVPPQ